MQTEVRVKQLTVTGLVRDAEDLGDVEETATVETYQCGDNSEIEVLGLKLHPDPEAARDIRLGDCLVLTIETSDEHTDRLEDAAAKDADIIALRREVAAKDEELANARALIAEQAEKIEQLTNPPGDTDDDESDDDTDAGEGEGTDLSPDAGNDEGADDATDDGAAEPKEDDTEAA